MPQLDHYAFVQTQFLITSHRGNIPTSGRVLHVEIETALWLSVRDRISVEPGTFFALVREKGARLYLHTMTNQSQQRR